MWKIFHSNENSIRYCLLTHSYDSDCTGNMPTECTPVTNIFQISMKCTAFRCRLCSCGSEALKMLKIIKMSKASSSLDKAAILFAEFACSRIVFCYTWKRFSKKKKTLWVIQFKGRGRIECFKNALSI